MREKEQPKYVLFDAKGKILGRLATEIAKVFVFSRMKNIHMAIS
jgi:ribosomal protein L13